MAVSRWPGAAHRGTRPSSRHGASGIMVDGVADLFRRLLGPGIELRNSCSSYHGHAKESRNVRLCLCKSLSVMWCLTLRRISGKMTGALCTYAATFVRYSLAVTPKNYLLFLCHFVNAGAQLTPGYRYLQYHHWGGGEDGWYKCSRCGEKEDSQGRG
jgi:hypothetical protein